MKKNWKIYAFTTILFWGIWGALIELPQESGFPATLGYTVWAITMIPCSILALKLVNWKIDIRKKTIANGLFIGLTGAGGQLILFEALKEGPAYLIFPIVSLNPAITIILSIIFLKENTNTKKWIAISLAILATVLLSYQVPTSEQKYNTIDWLPLTLLTSILWGAQALVMKSSSQSSNSENIFLYMTLSGILLIPIALYMTDFSSYINWGLKGPYLAGAIQIMNAIGALTLVYSFRYGKAIIVAPTVALAPVLTIILSLLIHNTIPNWIVTAGLILSTFVIYTLAKED